MLQRIEEIQGIGLLHAANGKSFGFRKATLIYADNGRGKSTLAAILRSLSTGDPAPIQHRKTVDGTLPEKAVIQFENGLKATFSGGAWSASRPELLVFDADFIDRNVYSGSAVNTNHRKSLLEFALGEAAVAARNAVDSATAAAKAAAADVKAVSDKLSGHHVGMPLSQFEKLIVVPDVDAKIEELQKKVAAASSAAVILAKAVPNPINVPSFDADALFAKLKKSLADVHAGAEQSVKQHVQKLGGIAAENWLSQGHQYGDSESCPYCGQDTKDNDLIRAYQTHFNEAYGALKTEVADLERLVLATIGSEIVNGFSQNVAISDAQGTAWKEQLTISPIIFAGGEANAALAELRELVLGLVKKKQGGPAEAIGTESDLLRAKELWEKVLAPMRLANKAIEEVNKAITGFKTQLQAGNPQILQSQLLLLQASKRRHIPEIVQLFGDLGTARTNDATAEASKKVERDKLDVLMAQTLDKYQKAINALLVKFGAAFTIKNMAANFKGGAPRSEYGLLLRGRDVNLEGGPPSFSTTLSEGDKRTLAFAFFIASTQADAKLSDRIIVIDDPMCSLDMNRRHHTKTVLVDIHSKATQLIVLAHDPYFIRDLRDAIRKKEKTAPVEIFQLAHGAGNYTDFRDFNVDKECESTYFRSHRTLNDFLSGESSNHLEVAKTIRPMLEGYLHRRFPGLLSKEAMFGEIVLAVRNAQVPSPLCYAQDLVDELNVINDYAGQYHHDTPPTPVESELLKIVKDAIALVHRGASIS